MKPCLIITHIYIYISKNFIKNQRRVLPKYMGCIQWETQEQRRNNNEKPKESRKSRNSLTENEKGDEAHSYKDFKIRYFNFTMLSSWPSNSKQCKDEKIVYGSIAFCLIIKPFQT